MRDIIFVIILLNSISLLSADIEVHTGKVYSQTFKTINTHNGFRSPSDVPGLNDAFQKSLKFLPESILVTSVLFLVNSTSGISEQRKKKLDSVFQQAYANILRDKQMDDIPSALPYSLSADKPKYGHYFLYLPPVITHSTKQIVFLHGYGGNFLFYIHVLKNAFKNSIIIVPSWGSSWRSGNYRYLQEVYADVKTKFSVTIKCPVVMAISAAGGAAFSFYNKNPERFKSLISFATCPYRKTINTLKPDLSIIMICGKYDKRFPWSAIKGRVRRVESKVNDFKLKLIAGDHFFFLENQKEWVSFLKVNTKLK